MPNLVGVKETQDFRTGEIVTKEVFTKHVENKEQFIKTYVQDLGHLAKCSGAEQSVVLCALKYLDYDTNELILTQTRREDIATCGNMKFNTVNTSISRLVGKNFLIRKGTNHYILNPKIFFYGKDMERAKIVKATITYIIGETPKAAKEKKTPVVQLHPDDAESKAIYEKYSSVTE